MDHNWLRAYLKSLEDRVISLEEKMEKNFEKLDSKIGPLTNFKHETMGRTAVITAIFAIVTTGLIQFAIAIFKAKSGN